MNEPVYVCVENAVAIVECTCVYDRTRVYLRQRGRHSCEFYLCQQKLARTEIVCCFVGKVAN